MMALETCLPIKTKTKNATICHIHTSTLDGAGDMSTYIKMDATTCHVYIYTQCMDIKVENKKVHPIRISLS